MEPTDERRTSAGSPAAAGPVKSRDDDQSAEWLNPFMPADDVPDSAANGPGGRYGNEPSGRYGAGGPPPSWSGGGAVVGEQQVAWYVPLVGRMLMLFAIGMIVVAVVGGLSGIGVPARDTNTYTVPLTTTNPTIHIESTASNIHIQPIAPGGANAVTVVESIEVRNISPTLAQRSLEAARIAEPTISGGIVQITARPREEWSFFFQRDVEITVYVPQNATIELDMQAGNATIERLSGRIDATISAGNLDLLTMKIADGSRVVVNAGNVRLEGELLTAASLGVEVNAGNATILLPFTTDARLNATADAGHLDIADWTGLTKPATSGRRGNQPETISGVLYTDPNPKSLITIKVHAGNATLRPTNSSTRPPEPEPVPPLPRAPQAP